MASVVTAATTRQVLRAVAEAITPDCHDAVTRVDIRDGWGGAIHVRVYTGVPRHSDVEFPERLRAAVARVVPARHRVEVVWGPG
jgi:hypothetical protein